ncbi:hypothetical protein UFOVP33_29 [uncultured Caudovirales phage]|uniref:Uncharacterized protein n=1 Tax=uncultured Caudovirales phage TaxID=2100421 RepID=A0A6J5KMY9_9CAUD|nr:hypothetical protein UFOVP33_29 [uncultured Caudovirales phage]
MLNRTDRAMAGPVSLLDPSFKYTPSSQTDVTRTWKRFGWAPADPRKQAQMKAKLNG